MVRAILTDIEGTTSSLSFVKEVLFPYARERLGDFVRAQGQEPQVRELLQQVAAVTGKPITDEEAVIQLRQWVDEDRKITPLKALQGLVWETGYRNGDYLGHVYPDAVRHLRQWRERGLQLYVYSSGSVHAQKLLFGHTEFGDLTPLFSGYFDTRVGAKQEAASYRKIAAAIALPAEEILFLSDIEAELDAASEAGMKTCWLLREGAMTPQAAHPRAADFDYVEPHVM
jgi:enolase-phosphatase E1